MGEHERTRERLQALGFSAADAAVLASHFLEAERSGRSGHGLRRVAWLEGWPELETSARPLRLVSEPGFERWDGNGALGYLVLEAIVEAQIAEPPTHARVVVAGRTFPTGMLGHWTGRLADAGLVAALTATSPRRLGPPAGGPKLTGTNPLSIAIPSSEGGPVVADVSMGNLTYGDVLAGRASEDELAPFGGGQAHKAFALAVGLQLLVDALTPEEGFGAVLVVARPASDPVPALRKLAAGARLPGGAPVIEVRVLEGRTADRYAGELAAVLFDCVEGGASIGFMASLTLAEAHEFYEFVCAEAAAGRRLLLAAFAGEELVGTVQVLLATLPNGVHRGEIAKLLVRRSVRRQGVASALIERAESEARAAGKTLLVLDAVTDGDAARLYARLGWRRVGEIPGYALFPDGSLCTTTYFYKQLS